MKGLSSSPRVTAVIPAYNGERYISAAIESALGQVGLNLELIVVDDCSTDGTADIVRSYPDARLISMPRRGGNAYASANVGLSAATCEFVAVLHQDDLWHPDKLATQVAVMERDPRIVLSYSGLSFIDGRGATIAQLRSPLGRGDHTVHGHAELRFLCVQNYINVCNGVARRGALEAVGGFSERLWFAGEWSAWLRMAAAGGRIAYIDRLLSSFRVHPLSQTQSATQDVDALRRQLLAVLDDLFAKPGLPQGVRARRRLALANVELSTALMSAYWSNAPAAISALSRLVRLLRPWELPTLVHVSGVIPRTQARLRGSRRAGGDPRVTPPLAIMPRAALMAGRGTHR